jgi:hypothetical protein
VKEVRLNRFLTSMLEQVLQDKIVEVVKAQQLLEFIVNKEAVSEPLRIDEDDHYMPEFLIDSLLRRRYAESASRVLKSLDSYDLITGESILSISLKTGDILKPDLVLFNPIVNQIIVIENKMQDSAEREAVTELLGFANEIRNHLPFISNLDIHYILISPDFKTLLDHSVSAQLLGGHINILCLKPVVSNDDVSGLEIHFPKAWTDLGQNGLPPEALVSYTMCLYPKDKPIDAKPRSKADNADQAEPMVSKVEESEEQDDEEELEVGEPERLTLEMQRAITMAADLITHEANNFHSNGFSLVWVNGFDKIPDNAVAAISVYILNPFAFLPEANKRGFTLRKDNPLYKYLSEAQKNNGGYMFPSSMFAIADKAERYLKNIFDVRWERLSNWVDDLADTQYAFQRQPILFNSFGVIGDFIRYFYLHPAVQRHWLLDAEKQSTGYNSPVVSSQFINLISGNVLFKNGDFSPKDVFLFGKYLGLHYQAQQNGWNYLEASSVQYDSWLFWTALPVIQGLKEIQMRLHDAKNIETNGAVAFAVAINRDSLQEDFKEHFEKFHEWFGVKFLDREKQRIFSELFDLGVKYGAYFDDYLSSSYPKEHLPILKKNLIDFAKYVLGGIGVEFVEKNFVDDKLRERVSNVFFGGKLMKLKVDQVDEYLEKSVDEEIFLENFEDEFLEILNDSTGNLIHELEDYEFLDSIDWQWMFEAAQNRFREGAHRTTVFVGANGQLSLGQLDPDLGWKLTDPSEVLIQGEFYASGVAMVIKVKWEELLNRTFKFADLTKAKGEIDVMSTPDDTSDENNEHQSAP